MKKYYVHAVNGAVIEVDTDDTSIEIDANLMSEISEAEAKALQNPQLSAEQIEAEAERVKEATLATLTVTVASGKVFYADLASRVDIDGAIRNAEEKNITQTEWKLAQEVEGSKYVIVTLAELKEASYLALKTKGTLVGVGA